MRHAHGGVCSFAEFSWQLLGVGDIAPAASSACAGAACAAGTKTLGLGAWFQGIAAQCISGAACTHGAAVQASISQTL